MKQIVCLIAIFSGLNTYSQIGSFNLGARSSAMGGASLTLPDEYSLFNNIGGLGRIERASAFASYQNKYGVSQFQVIGAGAVHPFRLANAGVGFYKFGDDLYSEQRVHLAISNQIQLVSLGFGVDLLQYNLSSIGSSRAVAIQFGGIAEITPQLRFGAHIFNLNQAKVDRESGEKIPTVMKAGLAFLPSEELILTAEVEKDLDFKEIVRAGVEYKLVESVYLRTGISTEPFLGSFGLGFHPRNLKFDYAFSRDSRLGNSHEVSLAYTFKK